MFDVEQENRVMLSLENSVRSVKQKLDSLCNDSMCKEEIEQIGLENKKLKYRLSLLNKSLSSVSNCNSNKLTDMVPIKIELVNEFSSAISLAYPGLTVSADIATSGSNQKSVDYQCNSAMQIAKKLKADGIKFSLQEIGLKIVSKLRPSILIEKCDVAVAGFINIYLRKSYGIQVILSIIRNGVCPPKVEPLRVVVDFSSPNIAKEMHVGHLRSTIIGDSICRLLEFLGHNVIRLNHIGDWGTQFGMLVAHLQDRFPDYLTASPSISDLQAFYKESKARFDSDEDFRKKAYSTVVQLQGGNPECTLAWNLICEVSRKGFQSIYDELDIKLIERGESFYQSRMVDIVREFEMRGFLEDDEGRKIMWGNTNLDNDKIPLTIVKSDGGYTYDTSDMATIRHRIEEEKADWIIYVTDAGQSTHFKTIFSCAQRAGILDLNKHRVDHIGFGVVLGEDGKKFKTRSGDTVKLMDLLIEGRNRAMQKLIEKGRDKVLNPDELIIAQKSIAYGCIKYSDLAHNRNNEYVFSFDRMLEDKGNTAIYLLYAYTRIKSIARQCGEDFARNICTKDVSEMSISLDHEKEWKLTKVLLKFPDVVLRLTEELCLHHLCEFVYEVSTTFSEFYDNCYCIEKDGAGRIIKINSNRLLLAEATALVLRKCFDILGLKPLDRI